MPLVMNAGPNNLIPSKVGGVVTTPSSATWFEGALTVDFESEIPVAVLLDFALDKNYLFSTVPGYSSGYVTAGYLRDGYIRSLFYLAADEYVDHEYVTPEYVVE